MRIKANPVVVSSLLTLFSCTSVSLAADRFVSPTGNLTVALYPLLIRP